MYNKKEYDRRYYQEHKEKMREQHRQWVLDNQQKHSEYQKEYHEKNKGKKSATSRKRKTGFTAEMFADRVIEQNNLCAICLVDLSTVVPHADHDHLTGQQRGVLCNKCNVALGGFRDSAVVLERAAEYIRVWNGRRG